MTRGVVRMLAWLVLAAAAVALLALPENRYDWMAEMDPGTAAGAVADRSGDSRVAAGIAALSGVAAAAGLVWSGRGWRRWAALALGVATALLWAVKFAG